MKSRGWIWITLLVITGCGTGVEGDEGWAVGEAPEPVQGDCPSAYVEDCWDDDETWDEWDEYHDHPEVGYWDDEPDEGYPVEPDMGDGRHPDEGSGHGYTVPDDIPYCSAEDNERYAYGGTHLTWSVGAVGGAPSDEFPFATPARGTFVGLVEDGSPLFCDDFLRYGFDCDYERNAVRLLGDNGVYAHVHSPIPAENIDLDPGESVTVEWTPNGVDVGLRVLDEDGEVVMHLADSRWAGSPFEAHYGDLMLRLSRSPDDWSTTTCVLGPPADCPRRLERLLVMGDETMELRSGLEEMKAGDATYRVGHFQSSVPFTSAPGCDDIPEVGYGVIRIRPSDNSNSQ